MQQSLGEALDDFDQLLPAVALSAGEFNPNRESWAITAPRCGVPATVIPLPRWNSSNPSSRKIRRAQKNGIGGDTEDRGEVLRRGEAFPGSGFTLGDGATNLGGDLIVQRERVVTVDLDTEHDTRQSSTIKPSTTLPVAAPTEEQEAEALVIEEARRHQRMRRRALCLVLLGAALVAAVTYAVTQHSTTTTKTTPTAAGRLVTVNLPVTRCPTSYGVTVPPTSSSSLPSTLTASLPRSEAGRLGYYTDEHGSIAPVLGPRDWSCHGLFGADGSGGISLFPGGGQDPGVRPGGAISPDTQAVIAYREPACQDCVLTLVCPLFPNVATALRSIGLSCHVPPVTEQDSWRRGSPSSPDGGAVAFVDPAHVKGNGISVRRRLPGSGHPALQSQHQGTTERTGFSRDLHIGHQDNSARQWPTTFSGAVGV